MTIATTAIQRVFLFFSLSFFDLQSTCHPEQRDSLRDTDISAALQATGLPNLADGVKKYKTVLQNSLRIACFPFVDVNGTDEYRKLTDTIDEIVRQLRNR